MAVYEKLTERKSAYILRRKTMFGKMKTLVRNVRGKVNDQAEKTGEEIVDGVIAIDTFFRERKEKRQMKFNPAKIIKALNDLHEKHGLQSCIKGNEKEIDITHKSMRGFAICLYNFGEACEKGNTAPIRLDSKEAIERMCDLMNALPDGDILKTFFKSINRVQLDNGPSCFKPKR